MRYQTWWQVWVQRTTRRGKQLAWEKENLEKVYKDEATALDRKRSILNNDPTAKVRIQGIEEEV